MCSFGALLHGVKSSSMCKATMIDNVTVANKIVHKSVVGGSIATALRDHRQSCVIPIQPNRSLPVHPAPHHTHCRSNIVKAPTSSLVRTAGFIGTGSSSSSSSVGSRSVCRESLVLESPQDEPEVEVEDPSLRYEDEVAARRTEEAAKIERIENQLIESLEDLTKRQRAEEEDSKWSFKMMWNHGGSVGITDEAGLIDITRSPERIDLSGDPGSDETTSLLLPVRLETTSSGCGSAAESPAAREKRKRRRRSKKINDGPSQVITGSLSLNELGQGKTVPPLRLKKIQTLQEHVNSVAPNLHERKIDDAIITKRPEEINREIVLRNDDFRDIGSFGNSSKYRIVTGHTPPYDDIMDCITLREPRVDSLDAAKLKYKRSKLIVKLRQLKRKTVELGNEMLRTVLTSPSGPHARRELQIRQKLNRYKVQIENLEKLLSEWPEVASYVEDSVDIDCQVYDSSPGQNPQVASTHDDFERVFTQARVPCSSNSSSRRSSPSLEPPKLSPKFPTNYETTRSPSELRNSPPILPRVYVTITDCTDDSCDEKSRSPSSSRPRNGRFRKKKSPNSTTNKPKRSISSSHLLDEKIVENCTSEKFKNDEETLVKTIFEGKKLLNVGKRDLDVASSESSSLEVLEVYEDSKQRERVESNDENLEIIEPLVKRSSSPRTIVIDKSSPEIEPTGRTEHLRVIAEAKISVETTNSSPEIFSTEAKEIIKEKITKDVVTLRDEIIDEEPTSVNGIPISEQFPTLADWIANNWCPKKQFDETASATLPDLSDALAKQPTDFQVFNTETVKTTTPEVPLNNAIPALVKENPAVAQQWRNESWQEQPAAQQQQQQQPPPSQSYGINNVPLQHSQPSPALGQGFCSPIAMAAGLYARNYIDPYSMAYGYNYNSTIAAAASLWNGAAFLQYPLLRPPSALLNAQQTRMSSGNLQFPAGNAVNQRPSSHRVSMQNEAKRMKVDNSLNYVQRDSATKLHTAATGLSSSFDQAKRTTSEYQQHSVSAGQSRISFNSVNSQAINYKNLLQQQQQQQQQQHQQQQPQDQQQFGRSTYTDSRLSVSGAPWRTGHLLGAMGADYNYPGINGWSSNSANILNSRAVGSTPSFVTPSSVLSINSSRPRIIKESLKSNFRNCNTPNLGKVHSSPNTVSCSNCGLAGPMFKCLGCEVAYYCEENCQALHWKSHVKSCPKKMPRLKKVVH